MKSPLESERPERLVDTLEPHDLVSEVERLGAWSERATRATDYLLVHWTAQHAARRDAAAIAELESVIGTILDDSRPPSVFAERWRGLYDALEARRRSLAAADPERIRRMRHVAPILEHLENGPCSQVDLIRALTLPVSPGRMSQIASLLEANGLVEVTRHGREVRLALPTGVPPVAPVAASTGRPRTTRSLLSSEPRESQVA